MNQETELLLKFLKSLLLRVRSIDQRLVFMEQFMMNKGTVDSEPKSNMMGDKHGDCLSADGTAGKGESVSLNLADLEKISIFQDLSIDELSFISSILQPREFDDQQLVFNENSKGDSLFLITQGSVRIFREESGRRQFISNADKGAILGEMAFVDDGYRSASAMARGKVRVLELMREDLEGLARSRSDLVLKIFRRIMQIMSTRLRFSNEHYAFDFKVTVRQEMIRLKRTGKDLVEILKSLEEI